MKEIISYLYKLNITDTKCFNGETLYLDKNNAYLYKKISDDSKIRFINGLINQYIGYSSFSYRFRINCYNDIISTYQDSKFVLIDVGSDYDKEISFDDMLYFYLVSNRLIFNKIKYTNNWEILWQNKIDYITDHFNNNHLINKSIYLIFSYYISIAENSLLYLIKLKKTYQHNNSIVSFVHRRIKNPNFKIDFLNPLNFIIDLEIRDVAEYIKSLYYSNKDYITDLEYYLKIHPLDVYSASLLYVRIIYPSVFLDDYEQNTINVEKYINFDSYEKFIKKIYDVITSYIVIEKMSC